MKNHNHQYHRGSIMKAINYKFSQSSDFLIDPTKNIKSSNCSGELYRVSKMSDDDNSILMFFYNNEKSENNTQYGQLFFITKSGQVFMQQYDDCEIMETNLRNGFERISPNPEYAYDFYKPAILAYGKKVIGSDFDIVEIDREGFYGDSSHIPLRYANIAYHSGFKSGDNSYHHDIKPNSILGEHAKNLDTLNIPSHIFLASIDSKLGLFAFKYLTKNDEGFEDIEEMYHAQYSFNDPVGHSRLYEGDILPDGRFGMDIMSESEILYLEENSSLNTHDCENTEVVCIQAFLPLWQEDNWDADPSEYASKDNLPYIEDAVKRIQIALNEQVSDISEYLTVD